jgi:hypothetical protein
MDGAETKVEISQAILERAMKLMEREKVQQEKVKKNLARYPHADPETLTFDDAARKYSVIIHCTVCGEERRVFTSDLFQINMCKKHGDEAKAATRKVKREELKAALDWLKKQGKI